MVRREVRIINKRGLHARAAAKFVKKAELFAAEITVEKSGFQVSGCSIMGLMMLAATKDCCIHITATGPEALAAMTALTALIEACFEEEN